MGGVWPPLTIVTNERILTTNLDIRSSYVFEDLFNEFDIHLIVFLCFSIVHGLYCIFLWCTCGCKLFTGIVGVVSLVSGVLASVVGYAITRSYTVM